MVRAISLLAAVAGSISAAELVVRNLSFDIEMLPTDFDYEMSDGVISRSGSDAFDQFIGIAFGARYSFASTGDMHGFLVGGQIAGAQGSYNGVGNLTEYGVRAEGGYGWAINDTWTISALVRLGYGWSTFDLTDNQQFSSFSLSGTALTYGVNLGLDFTINDNWQLCASAGYLMTSYDMSGGSIDATFDRTGFMASVGFLYRLSNQPSPLE